MSELPEPLTPADCDLRHYDWMPLTITVLKGSRSWMRCKRNPALAFYLINMWTTSWHQVPAASLEDDEDYLCDVAQCDPKLWPKLRETILTGFVKCADGRLYHQYVAREANKAWQLLIAQRARTEAATAARRAKNGTVTPSSAPPHDNVTNNVTSDVTNNATTNGTLDVTSHVTSPLRSPPDKPDQTRPTLKEESSSETTSRAPAVAVAAQPPPDVRTEIWQDGLAIVRRLTGKPEAPSRAFLGRALKTLRDDCDAGLAILHEAESLRPVDPEGWIIAACLARTKPPDFGLSKRKIEMLQAAGLPLPLVPKTIDMETEKWPTRLQ